MITNMQNVRVLSVRDRRLLAAEALMAERSVERALAGEPVRPGTRERLERAADRLGITLPPAPRTEDS
jgi:hypothetical protein